jgi:hypothetical protein
VPSAFGDDKGWDDDNEEGGGGIVVVQGGRNEQQKQGRKLESVLLDGVDSVVPSSALDLHKPGDEMPGGAPKQLYKVLQETVMEGDQNAVFVSDHVYILPGAGPSRPCRRELRACCTSWLGPAGREVPTSRLGPCSTIKRPVTLARSSSS